MSDSQVLVDCSHEAVQVFWFVALLEVLLLPLQLKLSSEEAYMMVAGQGDVEEVPISLVVWQHCQDIPIFEPSEVVDLLHR